MDDFKPSADFVSRTMSHIRSYEQEVSNKKERVHSFLVSRSGRFVLLTAGILFGMLNILGMISLWLSPAVCF